MSMREMFYSTILFILFAQVSDASRGFFGHDSHALPMDSFLNVREVRRTYGNGRLSGLTMELFDTLSKELGCSFRFLYPCLRSEFYSSGVCSQPSPDLAFQMLGESSECKADACPAGFYRKGCGNQELGFCVRCDVCAPGMYRVGCSNLSPGQCVSCPANTTASTYDYRDHCAPCSAPCSGATPVEVKGCTTTQDRLCMKIVQTSLSCSSTQYITTGENVSCVGCAPCPSGFYRAGCGGDQPGTCKSCPTATYNTDNSTYATSCLSCLDSPCPQGTWRKGCSGGSQGECVACSTCPAGDFRLGCGGISEGGCVQVEGSFFGGSKFNNVTGVVDDEVLCPNNQCLTAGAHKIVNTRLTNFDMTVGYMSRGFRLVVKKKEVPADLMAWAQPFSYVLWICILIEVLVAAACLIVSEGNGKNESIPSRLFKEIQTSIYWSFSVILGAADLVMETNPGRTLFMGQLIFAIILQAVYTGNLASFLANINTETALDRVEDLFDTRSAKYRPTTRVCYLTSDISVKAYLDSESSKFPSAKFISIPAPSLMDCLMMVYREDADCTFYDGPVVLDSIAQDFYAKGLCGSPGGFCSDPSYTDEASCLCSSASADATGTPQTCVSTGNQWTPVWGELVLVGDAFKPFGYGVGFRADKGQLGSSRLPWHFPLSQVLLEQRKSGVISMLEHKYIPEIGNLQCSAAASAANVLDVVNVLGLVIIVMGIYVIGIVVFFYNQIELFFFRTFPFLASKEFKEQQAQAEEEEEEEEEEEPRISFEYIETDCNQEQVESDGDEDQHEVHQKLSKLSRQLSEIEANILNSARSKGLLLEPAGQEEEDIFGLFNKGFQDLTSNIMSQIEPNSSSSKARENGSVKRRAASKVNGEFVFPGM
ncbi:hypothetical protein GUITHDRAFT_114856 [Guillardia theta CCMP2712]|uniref:TNFR-Cys domain-containing protein n=1 Tax=Guillardia theta (strain CCMP2712) TaxID=905079 RepID=L1IRS7_GUITC|nr:hypothetical protein GUITHDRAFT_114856 [Guillardia theta CCMP2712]EKX38976.1 hypothetical protein GUITHDRAFT_114856 [Guillardia theta CCMP2712]|eukprot:XP_005825956.1 hypothetical protein GUITHDRAFT_114856 [Guillardia theta CCMP2712]